MLNFYLSNQLKIYRLFDIIIMTSGVLMLGCRYPCFRCPHFDKWCGQNSPTDWVGGRLNILNKANNYLKIVTNLQPLESIPVVFLLEEEEVKLKLWIFICVLYPCFAFATMDSDASSVPANSKWTEIAVDKLDGMWGKSFDIVEYKMKQIAPHIVDMISNENEVVRARMYKNYLAQQAAKFAMDAAIEDMHMSSQQTSRAIKTYNKDKQIITVTKLVPGADGVYWLDRGALDSTECLVGDTGYYRCIYPNDYREKMLIISNGGVGITVEEDIDVNNKLYHVFTDMVYSTDSDNWQNATDVDFHIVTTRYPYAEYYNYMAIENKRADNNEKLADLSKQKIKKIRRECAASQGARITSVYDCSLESKAAVAEQEMMNAGVVVSGQTWSVSGQ